MEAKLRSMEVYGHGYLLSIFYRVSSLHTHENYVSKKKLQRTVTLPTNSQRFVVSASYARNQQSIYHDKYSAMNDSKVCWLRKESLYKVVSAYQY